MEDKRSTQQNVIHGDEFDVNEDSSCGRFDVLGLRPRKCREDLLITISIVCLVLGFVIMGTGYIIPREYIFDTSLPAREMERIEIYYANLSYSLDICILVGMGFIAFGGVIASSVFTYYFIFAEGQVYRKESRPDLNLLNGGGNQLATYGTNKEN
ncbi:Transmembrane protein 74B [Mactra antiquata]